VSHHLLGNQLGIGCAQIGLGLQYEISLRRVFFHHAEGRMMRAIFVAGCGNLLELVDITGQILFLPNLRQLFMTLAGYRLLLD
jgi:hypothetical protein